MDALQREEILRRYREHTLQLETLAARQPTRATAVAYRSPPAQPGSAPTPRELEVLQLAADGLPNREIGERLFLAEETIKSHIRNILAKLEATSRAQAVAVGFRRQLIA